MALERQKEQQMQEKGRDAGDKSLKLKAINTEKRKSSKKKKKKQIKLIGQMFIDPGKVKRVEVN